MAMEKKSSRIITIVLAIIIIAAVITVAYISLPKNEKNGTDNNDGNEQQNDVVLKMLYNDTYKNFTLEQLKDLGSIMGPGGYINSINVTAGPYELTGVTISALLDQFEISSENFSISVKAADNYTKIFNLSYINGDIPVYNETGAQIGTSGATMIINYEQNGEYLDNSTGPLRLAFISEDGFTSSKIWIKQVISILIIDD